MACVLRVSGKYRRYAYGAEEDVAVEYKTHKKILSTQSPFFTALLDDNEDGVIRLDADEWLAAKEVLNMVAMAPDTSPDLVISYPGLTVDFLESKAELLPNMWKLMHKWCLMVMIQRLKREIHANLFESQQLCASDLMVMETAISPQTNELFFKSCYGIALARTVFGYLNSNHRAGRDWNWQEEKSSPIWNSYSTELRKIVTRPTDERTHQSYWVKVFPCFNLKTDSVERNPVS